MNLNKLAITRFTLALLSIAAIALQPHIPKKKVTLHPYSDTYDSLYGQEGQYQWTDQNKAAWRCVYDRKSNPTPCGYILTWENFNRENLALGPRYPHCAGTTPKNNKCMDKVLFPLDFSKFDGINIKIHYEGRARSLEIKLNSFEPELAAANKYAEKRMSTKVHTKDLKAGHVFLSWSEFIVLDWWVLQNDIPRHLARPSFGQIVMISIDTIEHGLHKLQIEHIELLGERLKLNDLLIILAVFWFLFLFIEALIRYLQFYISAKNHAEEIKILKLESELMEQEKSALKVQSITDNLTGLLNRTGMIKEIGHYYENEDRTALGLMIIDIDNFKNINDIYGHDIGDQVIKTITKLISKRIRDKDLFARWGGEEFLLFCPKCKATGLTKTAEKLKQLVENFNFPQITGGKATISIGLTMVKTNESFSETFKCADSALYKAKSKRNRIFYEE